MSGSGVMVTHRYSQSGNAGSNPACRITQREEVGPSDPFGTNVKPMETTQSVFNELEEKIKKAFLKLKADDVNIASFLSKMDLKAIEDKLLEDCKTWYGDGRVKYHPMSMIKAFILKDLKGITSNTQLIYHFHRNDDERKLLGFNDRYKLPSPQTFSVVANERLNPEVRGMMDFIVRKTREIAKEEGKLLDIDFIPKKYDGKGKSKRTIDRRKSIEGGRIIRFLKDEIFPTLDLPLNCKARYGKDNFLDLLAYVAYNSTFANQGYQLMREDEKFEGKVPHARTLLGYLGKLNNEEILSMFIAAFERIFRIARSRGLLNGPVDLAMDCHDWLYYGDKNDKMVINGEYKLGTTKRFRFITVKIAEKYGDFTLLALPVGIFTNQREVVRTLIEFAKDKVNPRYFYIDRGFYSAKFLSLFEEMGIRYLMPGVKTKRVVRLIQKHGSPKVIDMNLHSADKRYHAKTKLAIRKDREGKDVCFATNLPSLMLFTANLFRLYSKRWNIETGYRVQKHEFRPNTTSKNYRIRTFYFMFSTLLYNIWVITNAMLSKYLFDEMVEYRLITAKMFMKKFYEAYKDYCP